MAKLWLDFDAVAGAKDDDVLDISFSDFNVVFGDKQVRFVHRDLAIANHSLPSGARSVVLEVGAGEVKPPLFGAAGFYLVEGLSPDSAREALRKRG